MLVFNIVGASEHS